RQTARLATRVVVAENAVQLFDSGEGGVARGVCDCLVAHVNCDVEWRAHPNAGELEPLEFFRVGRAGRDNAQREKGQRDRDEGRKTRVERSTVIGDSSLISRCSTDRRSPAIDASHYHLSVHQVVTMVKIGSLL